MTRAERIERELQQMQEQRIREHPNSEKIEAEEPKGNRIKHWISHIFNGTPSNNPDIIKDDFKNEDMESWKQPISTHGESKSQSAINTKKFCIFISNNKLSQIQMEYLLGGVSSDFINIVHPEIAVSNDIKRAIPFLIGLLANYSNKTGLKYEIKDLTYSRFNNPKTNQYGWRMEFPKR
jgi:hypothetical protein